MQDCLRRTKGKFEE